MSFPIEKYSQIKTYSDSEFDAATSELQTYVNNKSNYSGSQFSFSNGIHISDDLSSKNNRRAYYNNCFFDKAILRETGFVGGIFKKTKFEDCVMDNTNFQSCDFINCDFLSSSETFTESTTFDHSFFDHCNLSHMRFHGAGFTNVVMEDCYLNRCRFRSTSFENAVFKNTMFDHVRFGSLNLEYAHFENIHFDTVTLPFPSIPYIFNGLQYLVNTSDKVRITSALSTNHKMSRDEYLELLPKLEIYYSGTKNYFPLANIFLARQKAEEAKSAVILGIKMALMMYNYRLIKYLCFLLCENELFSYYERSDLYSYISSNASEHQFLPAIHYSFERYDAEIRNLLLNYSLEARMCLTIRTNIETEESEKVAFFLKLVEDISNISENPIKYYIDVRHSCPYDFFITFLCNPNNIIVLCAFCYSVFSGVSSLYKKVLENISLTLDVKKKNQELKVMEKDAELKTLEIEQKKQEIEKKRVKLRRLQNTSENLHRQMKERGIEVRYMGHKVSNMDVTNMQPEFRTHKVDSTN